MPIWRLIGETGAVRVLALASNIVVLFATARVLGADGRGELVSVVTWTMFLSVVAGLSLGQVMHRELQRRDQNVSMEELATTLLVAALALSLISLVAISLLILVTGSEFAQRIPRPVGLLAALLLPLLILDEYGRNLLAAYGRLRAYSVAQIIGGGSRLLSVLAVLIIAPSVTSVLACLVVAQGLTVALEFAGLETGSHGQIRFARTRLAVLISDALRLHPNTVASFLLVQANVLLLSTLSSNVAVAQYQLAQQLAIAPILLPQAAAMVQFGIVARLGPDQSWPETRRLVGQIMALIILVSLLAALIMPPAIRVLAADDFGEAGIIFRWLLVATAGAALSELMAPQWFARGYFLISTILTLLNAVASVLLSAYLIRRHGAIGAAWGTAASFGVFVVLTQIAFIWWCESRYRRMVGM